MREVLTEVGVDTADPVFGSDIEVIRSSGESFIGVLGGDGFPWELFLEVDSLALTGGVRSRVRVSALMGG